MNSRMFLLSIFILCITVVPSTAQSKSRIQSDYISLYKDIAIREMRRAEIPASITLAQGLLESEAGQSWLAKEGNNHFGLKCGNNWYGETIYKTDDDIGRDGNLVPSCFRKFDSAEESFRNHSDFLHAPNKPWYLPLFELDITDYKGWAKGLLKAGYATDSQYATRLIDLIERYELHQYDTWSDEPALALNEKVEDPVSVETLNKTLYINDLPYVMVWSHESIRNVADRTGVSSSQLIKYNDDLNKANQPLKAGQIVFLKAKKSNTVFPESSLHFVENEQTMVEISQLYGVKLSALLVKNKMKSGMEPAVGSIMKLRGSKVKARPELASEVENTEGLTEVNYKPKPSIQYPEREALIKPVITTIPSRSSSPVSTSSKSDFIDDLFQTDFEEKEVVQDSRYHVVQRGETLWRISQRYGISVEELKKWNELSDNTIRRGQKLRID